MEELYFKDPRDWESEDEDEDEDWDDEIYDD